MRRNTLMNIETVRITEALRITEAPGLDPITVILQDTAPNQGRIWVECYANAWASWWGAMGTRSVREFIAGCDPGYLASALRWGRMKQESQKADAYVERIAKAVIDALKAA
jgi:hypothetical protein